MKRGADRLTHVDTLADVREAETRSTWNMERGVDCIDSFRTALAYASGS
jgi:hypothetical protein